MRKLDKEFVVMIDVSCIVEGQYRDTSNDNVWHPCGRQTVEFSDVFNCNSTNIYHTIEEWLHTCKQKTLKYRKKYMHPDFEYVITLDDVYIEIKKYVVTEL